MTIRLLLLPLLLCVSTASCGCMIPTLICVRPVALPGWGETYVFLDPDGTLHDGGYLVAEYRERPGLGAKEWGIGKSKAELHVIPIVNGRASLPPKVVWKSIWSWGMDGWWHPNSRTSTYILAAGMDPFGSGPGPWSHGGEVGALYTYPADSPHARFRWPIWSRATRLVCHLQPVTELDEAHLALLERLRDATDAFAGFETFGLGGREVEVIREFAEHNIPDGDCER